MICSHDLRMSSWVSIEHIGLSWNWRLLVLRHVPDQPGLNQHKNTFNLEVQSRRRKYDLRSVKSTTWTLHNVVLKAWQGTSSCWRLRSSSTWCCSWSWGRPRWPGAGTTRPLNSSLMRSSSNGGKLTNPTFDMFQKQERAEKLLPRPRIHHRPQHNILDRPLCSAFPLPGGRSELSNYKSGPSHTFSQHYFYK